MFAEMPLDNRTVNEFRGPRRQLLTCLAFAQATRNASQTMTT
jgi:hypothetical protein